MSALSIRLRRLCHGIYTPKELCLWLIDGISSRILHRESNFYIREHVKRILKPYDGVYHIGDIKLPMLDSHNERVLSAEMFDDTFYSYLYCNDKYDEKTFDRCDRFLLEGLYGFVNDKVNVTVEPDDIVIDAGSWIGDFAAYASVKGAKVYAFEPMGNTFGYLEQTARLNANIIPVNKGLSDRAGRIDLSFMGESSSIETVRLDDFVRENNIERVDFIKADIEGSERDMLAGAQETLRRFAPKLALCTYHLPDDPQVMAELILKANPKYNIIQKRKKLFASVTR